MEEILTELISQYWKESALLIVGVLVIVIMIFAEIDVYKILKR